MTDKIVRFSTDITAADADRRTIVGTVVPYGDAVGNTSLGPVRFQAGSITPGDTVKLVLEHDLKRPIGKATGFVDGPERLVGTFRLSHTTAASDALVEASDGLRDGLSVGARINEHTVDADGTLVVTAADLVEVSLVHTPAFPQAVVSQVAASEPEDDDTPTPSEEDAPMSNETTEVEATDVVAAEPTVEAARPSMPYITAAPRDLKGLTAGNMLRHQLRAEVLGDKDSADLVKAAMVQASGFEDAVTADNLGVIPVPLMREIIGVVDEQRPFINSVNRAALPDSGMSFRIPKITDKVTVAQQTTQLTDVDSTEGEIEDITVNVLTFAGGNRVSRQLIDRSEPAYFDELLRQLASSYANVTDKAMFDLAKAGAVQSAGAAGAGIYGAITKGQADAYGVMRFTPDTLHVGPTTSATNGFGWDDILGAVDQGGRPLFAAGVPQNAAGLVSQGSTEGTVAGLRLVVNPNIAGNDHAHVFPSAFATVYEAAGAPLQVSIDNPEKLGVEVSIYGYIAIALKYPTAMRRVVTTPAE